MIAMQPLPLSETMAPADEAAVAEAICHARRNGTAVYPLGGGTMLDYGGRPSRPGVGLSLLKLNRLVDYPADDLTITVQPGMTLAELARHLAEKRQRLPVDVPQPEQATVGGVAATNPSGPRRYAYGTMRDCVIGLRAVDGRGMAFSGGGRVVKNAAGYNMCRLMVGSLGTLGVITQVTLMVRPMPETSAWVVGDLGDLDAARQVLAEMVHTQTLPAAVELLWGPAWGLFQFSRSENGGLSQFSPSENGTVPFGTSNAASASCRLMVGFEGSAADVAWMTGRLRDEWSLCGISSPVLIAGDEARQTWDWLTGLAATVEIHVLPSATLDVMERLVRWEPGCSIQAHAGNGVLRAQLPPAELPLAQRVRRQLRPLVDDLAGRVVLVGHGEGDGLAAADVWGEPPSGATVMQALKDRFDPDGVLNPGRLAYDLP